ncbi:DUF1329 domain-containing protein [Endozoicomonas numazuensis]|uniref:Outer membrane lipoprotein-sorting protein n=1 Tax=Endozoicomonas numazuensis TaxID=1137799 RepID=A0A081NMS8_9GAMM|nr:DUF1329 domain-containing protein [Endozoicomonas numazuensis]KEQ19751.1 hypothetical protein GZ78_07745 [Endozoicomonas numazuensis]
MIRTVLAAPVLVACAAVAFALNANAKVTPEEAKRLDSELTPMGAIRAGNEQGTIPAWNPDFKPPEGYVPGDRYPDPYANEKPILTITKENYREHQDKLSPGLAAMFRMYPRTFKMNVYPSHRDGGYSDFIVKNTRLNATRAEVVSGGNGIENAFGGSPFPIPKTGMEVVWNMTVAAGPLYRESTTHDVMVYRNGRHLVGRNTVIRLTPYFDPELNLKSYEDQELPRLLQINLSHAPSRDKGKSTLVHEFLNRDESPRAAWSYTPGVRRVRRAPTISYDTPQGLGKIRTTDSSYGFNGNVDKYDWTLVGKKEMYIPYNSYKFEQEGAEFKELLPKGHPNPEFMRYELHRVLVLEANLKKGERNVYKKRQFFIDEDTWLPILIDQYDNRGTLWRTSLQNSINMYDLPGIQRRTMFYFDLISREYLANEVYNREEQQPVNENAKQVSYFTPGTLRKLGVR